MQGARRLRRDKRGIPRLARESQVGSPAWHARLIFTAAESMQHLLDHARGGCTASYSPTGHIQSMPCSYHQASGHGRACCKMHRNCCRSLPKPKVNSCNLISLVQSLTCQRYWQGNKNLGENTHKFYISGWIAHVIMFKEGKAHTAVCAQKVCKIKSNKTCVGSVPRATLTNESHLNCHG